MKGRYSEILSSLLLLVATILLVVGLITKILNLSILVFFVLFFIEEMALRGILSFAVNAPKGFIYSIPLVVLSSFLVSYLITTWNLQGYFVWFVILLIGSGTLGLKQQFKEGKYMYLSSGVLKNENREDIEKMFRQKKKRHLLVFSVYVLFIVISFLLFNKGVSIRSLI